MVQHKKSRLHDIIVSDLKRYYVIECGAIDPPIRSKIRAILFSYGLHALVVYRIEQYLNLKKNNYDILVLDRILSPVINVLNFFVRKLYGIFISPDADIGEGAYIGHFGNININRCSIGKNCSIHQHTTLGKDSINGSGPIIGDYVWIGAHSIINNDVKVENNATIAAGSNVLRCVKEYALVMGNPARVINNHYDNSVLLGL